MEKLQIRALQIDLARQKERVDYVKSYADLAKKSGYNYVLLYLENAIRTPDTEFFDKDGTYSMEEMADIVKYIESIGLGVIPCFENLPHLEKFFAYPQLAPLSEHYDEKVVTRGYYKHRLDIGCTSNPKFYEFFDKYITDCTSLFKNSEYIMICHDELFDFAVCDKCRERLKNGETKKDMFFKHVMHSYELVKGLNKKMIMGDDFFEYMDISEDIPKDIILFNWNYGYIGAEPTGHWTSRRKKDWFRWYDKLGLQYVFAVYANRTSSEYNTDSFTKYANKYHPIGAVCTSWCKSESFYHGSYPFVYYTGKLWEGKINSEEDRVEAMAKLLRGNKKVAKFLLSNNLGGCGGGFGFTEVIENMNMASYNYLNRMGPILEELKGYIKKMKGESKDILTDIYNVALESYLNALFVKVGDEVFNAYESDGVTDKFIPYVDYAIKEIEGIKDRTNYLWNKYKNGIKSQDNDLFNKYNNKLKSLEKAKSLLKENKKYGTLTVESMLYDMYGTPKTKIVVNYVDGESQVVINGQVKPSLGDAHFTRRYKIQNKLIKNIEFSGYGEGTTYPVYLYYIVDGKKYIVDKVEKVCGECKDIENLLDNDTKCATLGIQDGLKCFEDIDSTLKLNTILITFKEL